MTTEKKPISTRVYRIQSDDGPVRLVRASQVRTAAAYVALQGCDIRVASQEDLISALSSGVPIEQAKPVPSSA